ncbi:unnamed protein product [marine sediment metagenome]|uniref:Uncharacterized protein n=1 Tax=marine sediment metagenome TaxID=412755 RepID=X0THU2_9ZZZZ
MDPETRELLARIRAESKIIDAVLNDIEREQRRQNELIAEIIRRQGVNTAIRDITPKNIIGDLSE